MIIYLFIVMLLVSVLNSQSNIYAQLNLCFDCICDAHFS